MLSELKGRRLNLPGKGKKNFVEERVGMMGTGGTSWGRMEGETTGSGGHLGDELET